MNMETVDWPLGVDDVPLFGNPGWTPKREVQWLCLMAQRCSGNILEIGCNNGQTTRELALANPDKTVYGVDFSGSRETMVDGQKGEMPSIVGEVARQLVNVRVLNQDSRTLELEKQFVDVGFIFIDGDHSYAGVKADTEKALNYLRPKNVANLNWAYYGELAYNGYGEERKWQTFDGKAMPLWREQSAALQNAWSVAAMRVLAHAPTGGVLNRRRYVVWHDVSESHPAWCGVLEYLKKEVAPVYPVKRVVNSWLAFLEV